MRIKFGNGINSRKVNSPQFDTEFWVAILYFSTIPWLMASWISWLINNPLITICIFVISLFPLKNLVLRLFKKKVIDIEQTKFGLIVIGILSLIFIYQFPIGDLSWDSNSYHLTVMNLIWQHIGYGDWPLVLGAQYGASLVTLQAALICGLLGDIRWVGFVNLVYCSGIFLMLSAFLREHFNSSIRFFSLFVTMLASTTILQSLTLAYTDIPLAFFVVALLCGLVNGLLGDLSKTNAWLVTFAVIGVIATKSSGAFLVVLLAPVLIIYFWKLVNFHQRTRWRLLYLLLTVTIALFSPVRSWKETGQPTYPFGSKLFSKPAPFDIQALNNALDGSRSIETQEMSIFHASFYNWFAAIPNFLSNSTLYLRGKPNNLDSFFVSDARPLAYGPVFHILLAAVLTFGLLYWNFTLTQRKMITVAVIALILVMSFGHTAPFLRYTYGVGLFLLPVLILIVTKNSQFLEKVFRILLMTATFIAIPLNAGVISEKVSRQELIAKESNASKFYSTIGDAQFEFPRCPKVYLLTQLPLFNAYIWGEKMCGEIVDFNEADLVISSQETAFIDGVNTEEIVCEKDGGPRQVTTIYGYPSDVFFPSECRKET